MCTERREWTLRTLSVPPLDHKVSILFADTGVHGTTYDSVFRCTYERVVGVTLHS